MYHHNRFRQFAKCCRSFLGDGEQVTIVGSTTLLHTLLSLSSYCPYAVQHFHQILHPMRKKVGAQASMSRFAPSLGAMLLAARRALPSCG